MLTAVILVWNVVKATVTDDEQLRHTKSKIRQVSSHTWNETSIKKKDLKKIQEQIFLGRERKYKGSN